MKYIIYKTTNTINGKFYIGLHETDNIDDGYLGSGILLKQSIEKHGKENFKKDILYIFDNKQDMIDKEKEIVNEDFVKRSDVYNMSKGGYGLCTLTDERKSEAITKMRNTFKSVDLKERSRKRIETILKKDPNAFKKMGILSAKKHKENYKNGYINPNQNHSDINILDSGGNVRYTCKHIELEKLCRENNLPYRVILKSIRNKGFKLYQKIQSKNKDYWKYKGWSASYVDA